MEPLFERLFDRPIFHCMCYSPVQAAAAAADAKQCWAGVWQCVLDTQSSLQRQRDDTGDHDTRSVVMSVLLAAGVTVALDVPSHLVVALGAFSKHAPEMITPALVRSLLRQSLAAYQQLPRPAKLRLLSYILKDEDFRDVHGIDLLPLCDGSFTQFSQQKTAVNSVCLPTQEFSTQLLPGLETLLVCTTDVDDFLQDKLRKIAQSGKYSSVFVV